MSLFLGLTKKRKKIAKKNKNNLNHDKDNIKWKITANSSKVK